jgi:hypothetical protein
MATSEDKWFEIWFSEGEDVIPTHLVLVMPDPMQPEQVLVLDPFEGYKTVYRGRNYEDVHDWLREDEYSLVRGRVLPDDGR